MVPVDSSVMLELALAVHSYHVITYPVCVQLGIRATLICLHHDNGTKGNESDTDTEIDNNNKKPESDLNGPTWVWNDRIG